MFQRRGHCFGGVRPPWLGIDRATMGLRWGLHLANRNVFNPVSEPRRRPPTHPGNIVRVEKCVFEIVDLFVGQVYPVARAWISLLSEKHHDSRETRSDAPVGTIVIDARFAFVFFLLSFSFLFFSFFFLFRRKKLGVR